MGLELAGYLQGDHEALSPVGPGSTVGETQAKQRILTDCRGWWQSPVQGPGLS